MVYPSISPFANKLIIEQIHYSIRMMPLALLFICSFTENIFTKSKLTAFNFNPLYCFCICSYCIYCISGSGIQLSVSLFRWLPLKKHHYLSHIIPIHDFMNAYAQIPQMQLSHCF